MSRKIFFLTTGLILSLVFVGFLSYPVSKPSNTYEFKIVKTGNAWKVVDANNPKNHKIKAHRNDIITWTPEGTDAFIQFPDSLFNPVGPDDNLSHGYTKFLRNGKKLKLRVKESAKSGTYEYAVFCTADSTFASGDSPPKIIIK